MTKEEAIQHACATVAMAFHSMADYSEPSDGFCDKCPNHNHQDRYKNSGKVLRYVRDAVVAKLKADGFTIAEGFDKTTGDELTEK